MSSHPFPKLQPRRRAPRQKPSRKGCVEKARITHRKKAPNVAAQKLRDTNRKAAAQFQEPAKCSTQCLQLQRGGALFVFWRYPSESLAVCARRKVSSFTLKCRTPCVRSPNGT
jgi:hypothetical protein